MIYTNYKISDNLNLFIQYKVSERIKGLNSNSSIGSDSILVSVVMTTSEKEVIFLLDINHLFCFYEIFRLQLIQIHTSGN